MKWVRIVAFLFEKTPINYQKILEKCEMSFRSSENKNWTFRGSFGNFSLVFLGFLIHSFVFIRELTSIFHSMYDVKRMGKREITSEASKL